ncbi:putative toxin-antitoxin system toxin component, PIN family [Cognatilysobacter segetis]|uniref:putative toxin-antitoxin system toxin component, PIN family n=1 Tax=Cognatilysobacter segetis TaxID=2492394 RepID=UPI00105C0C7C|nr:putative toxin-antitoxin system toxin component, PIN family [Lysobacter segetis]
MRAPPTLVLDTNAWLDLLVFRDPSLNGLTDDVRTGRVRIAVDARALDELSRVLGYDALALDGEAAAAHLAVARSLATTIDVPAMRLPRCRDPDDQAFLEIAVAARARALLTRDAELLRMAGRMAREHGLAIVPPSAWRDALAAPKSVARATDQMSKR